MSIDSKEPSLEEVKVGDESNASDESEVKNASETKSKGKNISSKTLSPAEIIKTFEDAQQTKKLPDIYVGDYLKEMPPLRSGRHPFSLFFLLELGD